MLNDDGMILIGGVDTGTIRAELADHCPAGGCGLIRMHLSISNMPAISRGNSLMNQDHLWQRLDKPAFSFTYALWDLATVCTARTVGSDGQDSLTEIVTPVHSEELCAVQDGQPATQQPRPVSQPALCAMRQETTPFTNSFPRWS